MDDHESIEELTTSNAVPPIVKPFALVRKRFPATLSGVVDGLKRQKAKLAKRLSKNIKPSNSAVG